MLEHAGSVQLCSASVGQPARLDSERARHAGIMNVRISAGVSS
jgi:hypothetical protein